MSQPTAREQLLNVIQFTECANQGTTPDALLNAYRDEVLASEAGERWIRSQEEQLGIKWADFRAGRWEMDLAGGRDFAAAYVAAARALLGDAPNYSETRIEFDVKIAEDPETYTLVVQRHAPGALTPHEARQQAEREAARLQAELTERTQFIATLNYERERALGQVRELKADLRRERAAHSSTIDERDRATDYADRLATIVVPIDVRGEHSIGNCPWQNALDYAAEQPPAA